jgi:hypothetical protein
MGSTTAPPTPAGSSGTAPCGAGSIGTSCGILRRRDRDGAEGVRGQGRAGGAMRIKAEALLTRLRPRWSGWSCAFQRGVHAISPASARAGQRIQHACRWGFARLRATPWRHHVSKGSNSRNSAAPVISRVRHSRRTDASHLAAVRSRRRTYFQAMRRRTASAAWRSESPSAHGRSVTSASRQGGSAGCPCVGKSA